MREPSCRHRHFSWFKPLTIGTTRLFCATCGKWEDEIRAKPAQVRITRLRGRLRLPAGCARLGTRQDCEPTCQNRCVA